MSDDELTRLLHLAVEGDPSATEKVVPRVYDELRRLAVWNLSRLPHGETLRPTALINEAWLQVAGEGAETPSGRRHFYFLAARAMRDILVDAARRKGAAKRGGDRERVEIEDFHLTIEAPTDDMLDLDRVLKKLEDLDPEGYELVMLRYFAGLTMDEVVETTQRSRRTLERRWSFVRAWLRQELGGAGAEDSTAS